MKDVVQTVIVAISAKPTTLKLKALFEKKGAAEPAVAAPPPVDPLPPPTCAGST